MPLIITRGLGQVASTPTVPSVASTPASLLPGGGASPTDFGQDFDFRNGLNPAFPLVGGYTNLGQALAHRLETPRGGLWYDPSYGYDLRQYLNAAITAPVLAQMNGGIQAECVKDERVFTVTPSVTFNQKTSTLNVVLNGTSANGPFSFVMAVTKESVTLLQTPAS